MSGKKNTEYEIVPSVFVPLDQRGEQFRQACAVRNEDSRYEIGKSPSAWKLDACAVNRSCSEPPYARHVSTQQAIFALAHMFYPEVERETARMSITNLTISTRIYLFIYFYLFKQYLDRGAQFSEAGLNGALFNINLLTNNILQNTEVQITKVLT